LLNLLLQLLAFCLGHRLGLQESLGLGNALSNLLNRLPSRH
jgi:hypothetical protein